MQDKGSLSCFHQRTFTATCSFQSCGSQFSKTFTGVPLLGSEDRERVEREILALGWARRGAYTQGTKEVWTCPSCMAKLTYDEPVYVGGIFSAPEPCGHVPHSLLALDICRAPRPVTSVERGHKAQEQRKSLPCTQVHHRSTWPYNLDKSIPP